VVEGYEISLVRTFIVQSAQLALHVDMGWLRLVGSLKLQVSFAEYRLFYRALLQKRPIILSLRNWRYTLIRVTLCMQLCDTLHATV